MGIDNPMAYLPALMVVIRGHYAECSTMFAGIGCIALQLRVARIEGGDNKLSLLLAVHAPAIIFAVCSKVGKLHATALGDAILKQYGV